MFYKLIYKDLFCYKESNSNESYGVDNLSGVFIKESKPVTIFDNHYFCFCLEFKNKSKVFLVDNECDYNSWIIAIKSILGINSFLDKYEENKKILGKGKFGIVKLGKNIVQKEEVAIKIFSKDNLIKNEYMHFIKTEIEVLKMCCHPNIIKLREICENQKLLYLVLDLCKGGCLMNYIERYIKKIDEMKIKEIMFKLLGCLEYLQIYRIVHRDLKPHNILMVDESYDSDIRIIDFGLSRIIGPNEMCVETVGSLGYVAPEVLYEKPYSFSADVWSIGVIAYLLFSKKLPFDSIVSMNEIIRKTIEEEVEFEDSIWSKYSSQALDFVKKLLVKQPKQRMTIDEALNHPFININKIVIKESKTSIKH